MYALNLTGKPVLITPPEILKKTGTNNNLDSGKLLPGIEIAETRFVQNADCLGHEFYEAMTAEKNREVTSSNITQLQTLFNNQHTVTTAPILKVGDIVNAAEFLSANSLKLWVTHLWKYVAECARYVAIPDNYVDFTSEGMQKNNPIGSAIDTSAQTTVGASLADVKFLMDKWLMERIAPLRDALKHYLDRNADIYPHWRTTSGTGSKKTAYVDLSIYRDQDQGPGCVWRDNNPSRRAPDSDCCSPQSWEEW